MVSLPRQAQDKHRETLKRDAFLIGRSGHLDEFDQAISFFLPNMTWMQPPGFVHKMVAETWSPHGLRVTVNGTEQTGVNANNATDSFLATIMASAQISTPSNDGSSSSSSGGMAKQQEEEGEEEEEEEEGEEDTTIFLRVASVNASSVRLSIRGKPIAGSVKQTTISSDDPKAGNWPSDPLAVSPKVSMLELRGEGAEEGLGEAVELPERSFTIFEVKL